MSGLWMKLKLSASIYLIHRPPKECVYLANADEDFTHALHDTAVLCVCG